MSRWTPLNTPLIYQNCSIVITQEMRNGAPVYWFHVNGRAISFVSNADTAKRLAINFVDVIKGDSFAYTKQVYITPRNPK